MLLPNIFRLMNHWDEFPPTHRLLRAKFKYTYHKGLNEVEQQLMDAPAQRFQALPKAVQDWIKDSGRPGRA